MRAPRSAVGYGPTALEIEVDDDGGRATRRGADAGAARAGRATGSIGMRERVAVFGGRFEAGPDRRGFRVTARLPLGACTT